MRIVQIPAGIAESAKPEPLRNRPAGSLKQFAATLPLPAGCATPPGGKEADR